MIYAANYHNPGYMPECDPVYFTDDTEAWDWCHETFRYSWENDDTLTTDEVAQLDEQCNLMPTSGADLFTTEDPRKMYDIGTIWDVEEVFDGLSYDEEQVWMEAQESGFVFTVSMKTRNDSMQEQPCMEMARLLQDVAERLEKGQTSGYLIDTNGNTVGTWGFE